LPTDSPLTDPQTEQWKCPEALPAGTFREIRNRLALEYAKWDPQVGDVATLARFPLILPAEVWGGLAQLAEQLAAEALEAECELLSRPRLIKRLGLPHSIARLLATNRALGLTPAAARVIRFDFHPTTDGWRISEANSDVPGGYTEASHFPRLLAEHCPGTHPPGDPAGMLVEALSLTGRGPIALISGPGYMEDQAVTCYLAGRLRARGVTAYLARPNQIVWIAGSAHLRSPWYSGPLGAVVRFYQGEWLAQRPARNDWPFFFVVGQTPVCNPGSALLLESKRFPVVWEALSSPLATWKSLLPPTRDPRDAPWRRDSGWLLKSAYCNTGDTVAARDLVDPRHWRQASLDASIHPGSWVAQRRFEVVPLPTPEGPMYPCLGVYTVNGSCAGVYARMAPHPLIDYQAIDVAVLIREESMISESWASLAAIGKPPTR
jgi:hypothetical protein